MPNKMNRPQLVIDVEATGPCPGLYSMLEIGAVDLDGNEFTCKMRPTTGSLFDPGAMSVLGLTEYETRTWPDPEESMHKFYDWLMETYGMDNLPVCWSDNPAFDWSFINYYMWAYLDKNPLGWSMRRIGDLYAGYTNDISNHGKWRKYRITPHTHQALDDAKGNAEALAKIFELIIKEHQS